MAENCPKSHNSKVVNKKSYIKDKISIKRCPYCSLTIMKDQDTCENQKCIGDHRLLTWDKWTEARKRDSKNLAKKTNRKPVDLVMNLVETVREDKEIKMVLEYAQIEKKANIRGGTLWQQPLRLKQSCPCKPVYEVQRTAAELGRPHKIQHIGVPKTILTEMGFSGITERPACDNLDFEYKNYRQSRENDLKDKIKKVDPYK